MGAFPSLLRLLNPLVIQHNKVFIPFIAIKIVKYPNNFVKNTTNQHKKPPPGGFRFFPLPFSLFPFFHPRHTLNMIRVWRYIHWTGRSVSVSCRHQDCKNVPFPFRPRHSLFLLRTAFFLQRFNILKHGLPSVSRTQH